MDPVNRFDSAGTYKAARLDAAAGLALAAGLAVAHLSEIRWGPFVGLFLAIDAIGYLPGAIAFRRSGGGPISPRYHMLYNCAHSLAVSGVVALVWSLAFGPEWALLALPIHLYGDRALFGNFSKPAAAPFEPVPLEAFVRFERELGRGEPAPREQEVLA